ncbi:MAG: hypothetical protein R3C11_00025 [Planctomycetaceae bacterium]
MQTYFIDHADDYQHGVDELLRALLLCRFATSGRRLYPEELR